MSLYTFSGSPPPKGPSKARRTCLLTLCHAEHSCQPCMHPKTEGTDINDLASCTIRRHWPDMAPSLLLITVGCEG